MVVFFYNGSFTLSYSLLGRIEAGSPERGLKTLPAKIPTKHEEKRSLSSSSRSGYWEWH